MERLAMLWDQICDFFSAYMVSPLSHVGMKDVIDILLLAVILYEIYRYSRKRRAGRVLLGLCFVVVLALIARALQMPTLTYIAELFAASAFFCVVVIFQPEIRDALEHLGNCNFLNPRSDTLPRKKYALAKSVADEMVEAVAKMSESHTGALIVFEGLTKLGDYINTGKIVDARVTSHVVQNIFYDKAPLHDGAMIVRDMRIWAANCVLPSSRGNLNFGRMGTRHRAAVGVTEVSDALAVMVSEETGLISVAQDGKLLRGVDAQTLRDVLMTYLAGRLYLRVRKGVYTDPFENIPKWKRYDESEEPVAVSEHETTEAIAEEGVSPHKGREGGSSEDGKESDSEF